MDISPTNNTIVCDTHTVKHNLLHAIYNVFIISYHIVVKATNLALQLLHHIYLYLLTITVKRTNIILHVRYQEIMYIYTYEVSISTIYPSMPSVHQVHFQI